jgi:hypothetical protein
MNAELKCGGLVRSQVSNTLAWRLVAGFPPRRPVFDPRSGHVGCVVDEVALGKFFSEYFGFPCQFSFHRLLHIRHHLSSGAGTIGQLVADVPSGLSLTPPHPMKLKKTLLLHTGEGPPTRTATVLTSFVFFSAPPVKLGVMPQIRP